MTCATTYHTSHNNSRITACVTTHATIHAMSHAMIHATTRALATHALTCASIRALTRVSALSLTLLSVAAQPLRIIYTIAGILVWTRASSVLRSFARWENMLSIRRTIKDIQGTTGRKPVGTAQVSNRTTQAVGQTMDTTRRRILMRPTHRTPARLTLVAISELQGVKQKGAFKHQRP